MKAHIATGELAFNAIENLPLELRTVYVMRYVQQKPRTEIVAALGIGDSDVQARLEKALGMLRLHMDGHLDIGSPAEIAHYREALQKAGMNQSYIDKVTGSNATAGESQ